MVYLHADQYILRRAPPQTSRVLFLQFSHLQWSVRQPLAFLVFLALSCITAGGVFWALPETWWEPPQRVARRLFSFTSCFAVITVLLCLTASLLKRLFLTFGCFLFVSGGRVNLVPVASLGQKHIPRACSRIAERICRPPWRCSLSHRTTGCTLGSSRPLPALKPVGHSRTGRRAVCTQSSVHGWWLPATWWAGRSAGGLTCVP